jgi:capsule biosynthesis phosphatase
MSNGEQVSGVVVDLDGTLAGDLVDGDYSACLPNLELIDRLHELQRTGTNVTIHTAPNMRTYDSNLELINLHTLPIIKDWLKRHNVPFDKIVVGKPWPGSNGLYVDDRAVRPDEILSMESKELLAIVEGSRWRG